ncbi:MAG: hypothetical protein LBR79_02575 [Oscillospiraceae bacterium]|jgi:hypothetical protein|nr:hypothetical protein [Oscillospiraceae bacterium]
MATNNTEDRGLLDIISGDKSLKFEIGLDMITVSYLLGGAMIVGILLIIISKKIVK